MCRYEMKSYKSHCACFNCRKTLKRRLMWDIKWDNKDITAAKCPQCGELMANMELFYSCGRSGGGYVPKDKERIIAYLEEILENYNKQLVFWRNRLNRIKDVEQKIKPIKPTKIRAIVGH